ITTNDIEVRAYRDFIQSVWRTEVFPNQSNYSMFATFWDNVLHDGYFHREDWTESHGEFANNAVNARSVSTPATGDVELKLFEPVGVGNGAFANNPWLQEMPDPITRVVWDNTLHI